MQKTLEQLGFEPKESKIYLALLELGEGGIADISRKTGLKRTTIYHILDSPKLQGLISQSKKGKRTIYIAEDPRLIGENIKEKEMLFQRALPNLMGIASIFEKKPKIRYFEGINGIKDAYKDELKLNGDEILSWWSKSYEILGDKFILDYYMPERLRKKIKVRAIFPDSDYARQQQKEDLSWLREIRLSQSDESLAELEISLYANSKLSIKSFQEGFALIIESKALFNTMKNIFETQWNNLKK